MKLKLEIEYDEMNKTSVEKEFEWGSEGSQFDSIFNELASALICCGISKDYVDENLDYMDNPKNDMQVYCTNCWGWDDLLKTIEDLRIPVPSRCKDCYPYDPEDSRPKGIRKNYSKA